MNNTSVKQLTAQQYALYYGAEIHYPETNEFSTLNWVHLVQVEHSNTSPVNWVLRLRKLSDITEEEYREIFPMCVFELFKQDLADEKTSLFFTPQQFIKLLQHHFDLFNWIEQGLAEEKK